MKKLLFILLILSQISVAQTKSSSKKLVILGDSLTEGYGVSKLSAFPSLLEKKLNQGSQKWEVLNSGVSGSTTASAVSRVRWMLNNKPDIVFIILGANDGLRGLKTNQSEKNLAEAIELSQKEGVKVILGGLYTPPNYGKSYAEEFQTMYSKLAKKYKVHLVPFILEKVAGDSKLNQVDGIHPNEAGHKVISETIYNSIKDQL